MIVEMSLTPWWILLAYETGFILPEWWWTTWLDLVRMGSND